MGFGIRSYLLKFQDYFSPTDIYYVPGKELDTTSEHSCTQALSKAVLEKKYVSMVLTGPQPLLEGLRTASVTSYVDVSGLEAGEHILPVQLHVEGQDFSSVSWIATPATVKVTLSAD